MVKGVETAVPDGYRMTELGALPEEWDVWPLGDICERPNYGLTASATSEPIGPHFLRITDLQNDQVDWSSVPYCKCDERNLERYRLRPGDLVVARIGATTGKTFLIAQPTDAVFASYLIRIRTKSGLVPQFMSYYTKSRAYWAQINSAKGGRLKQGVNIPILQSLLVPVPPLPEQHAIAQVLRTVQQAKEATERVVAALKELKKSLMRHLFTYGPVPLDQAERVPLMETEIGPVPEHWEVVRLGEVVRETQYGLSVRAGQSGKYPMLRMNNIENGRVSTTDLKYVDLSADDFAKFRVQPGQILFNRTNSYDLVGKTAIFNSEGDFVFASYLVRVVPDETQLFPEYLNYCLNSDSAQRRLKMLATRGVSQSNISATKLKRFAIPIPPLPQQREMACILQAVDRKIEAEEKRRQALEALFRTLLHHLMTGKVRVKNLSVDAQGDGVSRT